VLDVIIAPPDARQVYVAPPQPPPVPRLDGTDLRIIEAVRDVGLVKVWSVLNMLSDDTGLDRSAGRDARRALWDRVRRLKRLKLVFGVGRNEVTATRPPARLRARRRRSSVGILHGARPVSAANRQPHPSKRESPHPVEAPRFRQTPAIYQMSMDAEKTKSVPDPEQVTQAARSLASMPRRPRRRWSGMIGRIRSFKNLRIQLPDGRVVYALGAKRGRVVFTSQPDGPVGSVDGLWRDWGAIGANLVTVVKNPAAVLLGGLKRGIKEAPSALKASVARANGCRPVRAGQRPRGRPRRSRIGACSQVLTGRSLPLP